MSETQVRKGRLFEQRVGDALTTFRRTFPRYVTVEEQPRLTLHDGTGKIPDFSLQVKFPFAELRFLIECQDRRRSGADIADKTFKIKANSHKNRVIFVYAERIPDATRAALERQGDTPMSFASFQRFLQEMAETISRLEGNLESLTLPEVDHDESHLVFECKVLKW